LKRALLFLLLVTAALTGCSTRLQGPPRLPDLTLAGTDGASHRLTEMVTRAPFTVIVFFSALCPCQRAHDARLRELFAQYHPRGVEVVAVDAEATSTLASDREEARARSYPFPILSDPDGAVADALGAEYATYAVVVDGSGRVRYRGGLDSNRKYLTDDAKLWLRDALDDLLAGVEPAHAETTTLGCALRRR
jgi:peroxiredoxin